MKKLTYFLLLLILASCGTSTIMVNVQKPADITVSNNITNDLPNADTSLPKAITFNESVVNNDLEESDINDTPIKITDEDVKIEFDTFESNKNDEINLDNFVQELP